MNNLMLYVLLFLFAYDKAPQSIWGSEWSANGKWIAIGGDDSIVHIYNGTTYLPIWSLKMNSSVKHVNWHPHQNKLAVATSTGAYLLNVITKEVSAIKAIKVGGRAIGWNFDGTLLALADGRGVVQLMDGEGNFIRAIPKHNNHSYVTMDWHPQKNILITGSDEIILFDTSGKQLAFIKHRKEHTLLLTARWHPSGHFFTTGDYGHENEGMPTLLQFWRSDGTLLKEIKGHHGEMRNLKWNREGTRLATASDGLRIYSEKGDLLHHSTTKEILWGLSWHENKILGASFGDDFIAVWDSAGKMLRKL